MADRVFPSVVTVTAYVRDPEAEGAGERTERDSAWVSQATRSDYWGALGVVGVFRGGVTGGLQLMGGVGLPRTFGAWTFRPGLVGAVRASLIDTAATPESDAVTENFAFGVLEKPTGNLMQFGFRSGHESDARAIITASTLYFSNAATTLSAESRSPFPMSGMFRRCCFISAI